MNREFLINIIFLISINVLIKPFFLFGIDRTVQNTVGAETYGTYFALLSLTYLFGIVNDMGIQNYNNRTISQEPELLKQYFPAVFFVKILLGLAYFFVIFFVAWLWGYDTIHWHILFFLALNMIIYQYIAYLRSNISGLGMYRTDSVISSLDKLFMIIICSVMLWGNVLQQKFQIEWFVYAQTFSFGLTALIAFIFLKKHLIQLQFNFKPIFLFSLIKKAMPYALVIFLMTIYTRVDAIMVERLLVDGQKESGVYGAAYRLLDAANMIGFMFAGLLLPMFAKLLKEKESVIPLVRMSALMIFSGAITASVCIYFFRNEIGYLLYTEATPYWGEVIGTVMLSFVAGSGGYIIGTLLTANGNLKKMNWILFSCVFLNIILNLILIPKYKALGAAWTTVGTQFFSMIAQMILAWKIFNWKIDFIALGRVFIFTIALVATTYLIYYQIEMDWKVKFISSIILGIALAFLLKMLDVRQALAFFTNSSKQD